MRKVSLLLLLACLFGFGSLAYAQDSGVNIEDIAKKRREAEKITQVQAPDTTKIKLKAEADSASAKAKPYEKPMETYGVTSKFSDMGGGSNAHFGKEFTAGNHSFTPSAILAHDKNGDFEKTDFGSGLLYKYSLNGGKAILVTPSADFYKGDGQTVSNESRSRTIEEIIQNGISHRNITESTQTSQGDKTNGRWVALRIGYNDPSQSNKVSLEGRANSDNSIHETLSFNDYNEVYNDSTDETQGSGFRVRTRTNVNTNVLTSVNESDEQNQGQKALRLVYDRRIRGPVNGKMEMGLFRENLRTRVNTEVDNNTRSNYGSEIIVDGNGRSDTIKVAGRDSMRNFSYALSKEDMDNYYSLWRFGLFNDADRNPNFDGSFEYQSPTRRVMADANSHFRFGSNSDWIAYLGAKGFDSETKTTIGIGLFNNTNKNGLEALTGYDRTAYEDIIRSVVESKLQKERMLEDAEIVYLDNLNGIGARVQAKVEKGQGPETCIETMYGTGDAFGTFGVERASGGDYSFTAKGGIKNCYAKIRYDGSKKETGVGLVFRGFRVKK